MPRRRVGGRPLCPETPAEMAPHHRVRRIGGESGQRCPQSRRAAIRAHLRIERAKALLCQEGTSIADAALQCGFSHQEHLTRMFRRFTGTTPGRYRALNARPRTKPVSCPLGRRGIILAEAEHDDLRGDIRSAHHGQRRDIHGVPAVPMRVLLSVASDGLPTSLTRMSILNCPRECESCFVPRVVRPRILPKADHLHASGLARIGREKGDERSTVVLRGKAPTLKGNAVYSAIDSYSQRARALNTNLQQIADQDSIRISHRSAGNRSTSRQSISVTREYRKNQ